MSLPPALPSCLRFLDLTDEKGFLCGKILGDLGATVIKVEAPGGDATRQLDPCYVDCRGQKGSLYWFAFNASKYGITLDIEHPKGREILKKLVALSDGVIETFPVGYLDSIGLSYEHIQHQNPGAIFVSITPFGQSGVYRCHKGSDLTTFAMSGIAHITGEPGRSPLRFPLDQSYYLASAHAAVGTMLAYHHRKRSGRGQRVDISIYDCLASINYRQVFLWEYAQKTQSRSGRLLARADVISPLLWPCRDGYIVWNFMGGSWGAQDNRKLSAWMNEEGVGGNLDTVNWENVDLAVLSSDWQKWESLFSHFFLSRTKKELEEEALRRGIKLCGVAPLESTMQNQQLAGRDYWVDLQLPKSDASVRYPGRLFLSSEVEAKTARRAPTPGEHNEQIYGDLLGLSKEELIQLRKERVI